MSLEGPRPHKRAEDEAAKKEREAVPAASGNIVDHLIEGAAGDMAKDELEAILAAGGNIANNVMGNRSIMPMPRSLVPKVVDENVKGEAELMFTGNADAVQQSAVQIRHSSSDNGIVSSTFRFK